MASGAGERLLAELAGWRPEGGVASVYLEIEPGDRGESWRIELKDRLAGIEAGVGERIDARFPRQDPLPRGRSHVGFLELGGARREIWRDFQLAGLETEVAIAPAPCLAPLVKLLDEGASLGVVVVGLENVRVLEWELGEIEELDGWELEITSLDWHERKAQRVDPAAGTATSASGRDQYGQRLEHNRERFLKQAGGLVDSRYGDRSWRRLVVIGEGDRPRLVAAGVGRLSERVDEIPHDLIRATATEISHRVEHELERLNRAREGALVARVEEAVSATPGAALGPEEVLEATAEGRAHHVIFDATREWKHRDGLPLNELMIQRALATSAEVTPVEGAAAEALRERDGAAALLRY